MLQVMTDPRDTAPREPPPAGGVFTMHGRLSRVRQQNLLFSAPERKVFNLNDTAADIWRSLEEGASPEAVAADLAAACGGGDAAQEHLDAALVAWERLGLIRPSPSAAALGPDGEVAQTVSLGGCTVRIRYPADLAEPASGAFAHLQTGDGAAGPLLRLTRLRERVHLFRNDDWVESCAPDQVPVMLKGALVSEVLLGARYELALHAASLLADDRLLLLSGRPGAGKTTLALALTHAGFAFAGDDVTLLGAEGHGTGLPLAPAVKSGAWSLLSAHCPAIRSSPVFRRPDGRRVRFPVPGTAVFSGTRPVGWVVLLRRGEGGRTRLERVDPATAITHLLDGSFAVGDELTEAGFDALVAMIGSAEVYALTYSGLDEAVRLLQATCG
jgi:hypothetical protein